VNEEKQYFYFWHFILLQSSKDVEGDRSEWCLFFASLSAFCSELQAF